MSDQNGAQEAQNGDLTVDPQFFIMSLQEKIGELINSDLVKGAAVRQLQAQVAELQQELQQTRIERDALAETQNPEKAPAKS